jgi:hypothetical protein
MLAVLWLSAGMVSAESVGGEAASKQDVAKTPRGPTQKMSKPPTGEDVQTRGLFSKKKKKKRAGGAAGHTESPDQSGEGR